MVSAFLFMDTITIEPDQVEPIKGERRDVSLSTTITRGEKDEDVFTFIISKEEEDRHGTVVSVGGIDVAHFRNNPVVLFNHNYERVVGTAFNIRVQGDTLQASVRFAETEFAQELKGQVSRGEIRATSIGFMVKEWSYDEENDVWKILQSELLEFSIVTVPSNRSALIMRDAQVKSLEEQVGKLEALVERLTEKISGEDLINAINKRNDQPDQSAEPETSEPEKEELDEGRSLEPGEGAEPEEDQSHDTSEVQQNNVMTIEDAMILARKVVRRRLGKE